MLSGTLNTLILRIDQDQCCGCGRCVARCKRQVLGMVSRGGFSWATVEFPELCTGCGRCIGRCPNDAIDLNF